MDEQRGEFVDQAHATPDMPRLGVDEEVKIKGVAFKVVKIGVRRVVLEMLSEADRTRNRQERRTAEALERRQRHRRAALGQ